jgi:hypothetical protein
MKTPFSSYLWRKALKKGAFMRPLGAGKSADKWDHAIRMRIGRVDFSEEWMVCRCFFKVSKGLIK